MPRISCLQVALVCTLLAIPSIAHAQDATFVQAIADFINAVDGPRGDEGAALVAAIDAMATGLTQWDAAVARVEAGFASEIGAAPPPAAARMRGALGAVYLERGRVDDAVEQFTAALRLDPEFGDVRLLRGLAYQRLNRTAEAEGDFRIAAQRDPQNVTTAYLFLQTASKNAESQEVNAAMHTLSEALDGATASVRPQFVVLGFLDEASLAAPVFPMAGYADAFALIANAKYAEGVAALREGAARDPLLTDRSAPSSSEAHRILGMSLWTAREYEKSLAELRTAVRLNTQDERSRLAIADVLFAAGDPAGARAALDETVRALPKSGLARWKLGRLQQAAGDEESALRSFEAAASMTIVGGAGHLFAAIGRLHHNRLDLEAAEAAYARRVRAAPNDSAAHFDLGEVLRAQDKLREALVEYTVAALLDPASAKPLAMIGQVHASAGQDEEAVRILRKAVALDPEQLEAHYGLSRALLRLGKAEEAQQELAIFERLQSTAMEAERRRFQENQRKLQEALDAGEKGRTR